MRNLFFVLLVAGCANSEQVDKTECDRGFEPDPELHGVVVQATNRSSEATGCNVGVEVGGIPIYAQGFVFIGGGTETIYDSDPQLDRWQVCGATLSSGTGEPIAIFISTAEPRCTIEDSVLHEILHTMAPPGTHATDGIGAEGGTSSQTPLITAGTLTWVCSRSNCNAFIPE